MTIQELKKLFKSPGPPYTVDFARAKGVSETNGPRDVARMLDKLREYDTTLAHLGYRIAVLQEGDLDICVCPYCGYANLTGPGGCECDKCGECLFPGICEKH